MVAHTSPDTVRMQSGPLEISWSQFVLRQFFPKRSLLPHLLFPVSRSQRDLLMRLVTREDDDSYTRIHLWWIRSSITAFHPFLSLSWIPLPTSHTQRAKMGTYKSLLGHIFFVACCWFVVKAQGDEQKVDDDDDVIIQWNRAVREVIVAHKLVSSNVSTHIQLLCFCAHILIQSIPIAICDPNDESINLSLHSLHSNNNKGRNTYVVCHACSPVSCHYWSHPIQRSVSITFTLDEWIYPPTYLSIHLHTYPYSSLCKYRPYCRGGM